MITVACVLRSGGDFTPMHVTALQRTVSKHLQVPHQFRVLTDYDIDGEHIVRLITTWPKWWAKLELFRPGAFSGPVLYFDLDTMLVGSIDMLAGYRGQLALLSDFLKPGRLQSGVMAWTPGPMTEAIWRCFTVNPARYMRSYPGDGQFLNTYVDRADYLQTLFRGRIVSYNRHVQRLGRVPSCARVICFHGHPRPWTTPLWENRP